MSTKVAVICYSATGSTWALAEAIAAGAESAGAEVRLRRVAELAPDSAINSNPDWRAHHDRVKQVPEADLALLEWADAIIFGTPTRYGLPTSQLKQFIDQTGGLWSQGKLVDKVVSGFASAATEHGGHETTITALCNTFYHWGSIIVPPGYADPIQQEVGTPYGVSYASDNGKRKPDEKTLASARFQGRRVAEVAAAFVAGRVEAAR
jgi:NAD(P)H dehydrogenase (quinone)